LGNSSVVCKRVIIGLWISEEHPLLMYMDSGGGGGGGGGGA